MKWAQGWNGHEGWYLDFPFNGNATRKIPRHPMNRWNNNAEAPNIEYITRYGDNIMYRDLSNEIKTDAVADYFGAVSNEVLEAGVVVCGSIGEGELILMIDFDCRIFYDLTLLRLLKSRMIHCLMKYLRFGQMKRWSLRLTGATNKNQLYGLKQR